MHDDTRKAANELISEIMTILSDLPKEPDFARFEQESLFAGCTSSSVKVRIGMHSLTLHLVKAGL